MPVNKKYFHLAYARSPTEFNIKNQLVALGWRPTIWPWRAHFASHHLQFNPQVAETLEFKHLLARFMKDKCPQWFLPTFCLDDENWPSVLTEVEQNLEAKVWILKPALLNNGQHIRLFDSLSAIDIYLQNTQRLGGEYVLQPYLADPHLLSDNRKYSIRMFLVLSSYCGCFLYPQGYFNVAHHPYQKNNLLDLRSHLTNEHLSSDQINVTQIPSEKFLHFSAIYPSIRQITQDLVIALATSFPQAFNPSERKLAFFGLDFMLDASGKVWFLEANHGPCFPMERHHPLQAHLYQKFWQEVVHCFIHPLISAERSETIFDKLC